MGKLFGMMTPPSSTSGLPEPLLRPATELLHEILGRLPPAAQSLLDPPERRPAALRVLAVSRYVAERCRRQPELLAGLLQSGDLLRRYEPDTYLPRVTACLSEAADEADAMAAIRLLRHREMVRIAWRDIAGWADLEETLTDTSALAEACVRGGLDHLYAKACAARGTPRNAKGGAQRLVVLGMGKLGGGELNFSSDIDLIFAYPEDGLCDGRRELSCHEFFVRLCQQLIRLLDTQTADGFVFRVDTRLRPFGEAGPMAMSFDAMERYYHSQAREWERYAMIKARPIAGDVADGAELMAMLKPFVYRRYLDYRAFGELRVLKAKIAEQLERTTRTENIKLGLGGIREVEFVVQAFQLIRGGREPLLQNHNLLQTLSILDALRLLPTEVVGYLRKAYGLLRVVENRIQQYEDQQTQRLPTNPAQQLALAAALRYPDYAAFRTCLERLMDEVHQVFEQVLAAPQADDAGAAMPTWAHSADPAHLTRLGFPDPGTAAQRLAAFRDSAAVRRLSARGQTELLRLLPLALQAAAASTAPSETLERLLLLFERIASRHVYFTLLAENPMALSQLVKLTAASSYIADTLARHPLLLDDLIDPRSLYAPLSRAELREALAQRLQMVDAGDQEALLNELRNFRHSQVLKVAAADLTGAVPLMVVSDCLTWIAEVLLERTLALCFAQSMGRHEAPSDQWRVEDSGFGIIGYGKLGGLELGYGSDLDLVFLYQGDPEATVGNTTAAQFYTRLTQRLINALTAPMLSGPLYELDLRLRPSGKAGLLVSSLAAFGQYQQQQAWTWEHQALVRARFIAGDPRVRQEFERIRREALARPRKAGPLRAEVAAMRAKMRENLGVHEAGRFDLKHGAGGIIDIEFIVQFGILAFAQSHPPLLEYTDAVRNLERLPATGLITDDEARQLHDAYCRYRAQVHRLALTEQSAVVDETAFVTERARVCAIWSKIFEV